MVKYKKNNEDAVFKKSHSDDAGYDMSTTKLTHVYPHDNTLIDTGINVSIPKGYFGLLVGRSSLSTKYGCSVVSGVIDSGYTGRILVNVHNDSSHSTAKLHAGLRIAQLVIIPIYGGEVQEVTSSISCEDNERGDNGFGSTDCESEEEHW